VVQVVEDRSGGVPARAGSRGSGTRYAANVTIVERWPSRAGPR
jgi:hypothetical protein